MSLFLLSSFCCGGLLRYKKGSWEAVHLLPIWQHWPQKRPAKIWNRIWTDPQLNDLLDRVRKTGLQITKNKKVIKLDFNDMLTLKKLSLRTWCRHAVGFPFRAYRFSLYRSQIDPPPPPIPILSHLPFPITYWKAQAWDIYRRVFFLNNPSL
jgi:hypothetical protein